MTHVEAAPTFLVDWHAAELAAVEHMRSLGFIDAQVTAPGADGGIDAQSSEAAAQVKFYASPIGRPDVQRLRGAAHEYRLALFYSTGGFTSEAVAYANDSGVSLFSMDAYGRCEPVSNFASLLVAPEHVEARRDRLGELQAIRYRFAALAVDSDLTLSREFARIAKLEPGEAAVFRHVTSAIRRELDTFRSAIESGSFANANAAFGEIQVRMAVLSRLTSSRIVNKFMSIEEAIAEGWSLDTEEDDHLLQRAAVGVMDLHDLLEKAFDGWTQETVGLRLDNLIDGKTIRSAGVLLVAAIDPSILSPELLRELKVSVVVGVGQAQHQARLGFQKIVKLLTDANFDESSRMMVAEMVRADATASRIVAQLEASSH